MTDPVKCPVTRPKPSTPVPEGAFKTKGPNVSGNDVNAVLTWRDPKNPRNGYMIVMDYSRRLEVPKLSWATPISLLAKGILSAWNPLVPERLKQTVDIPRIQMYYLEASPHERPSSPRRAIKDGLMPTGINRRIYDDPGAIW